MTDTDVMKQIKAARSASLDRAASVAAKEETRRKVEGITSPDAKAAREVVRQMQAQSLPLLALSIAKVTSEMKVKVELKDAVERFFAASSAYLAAELKPAERMIGWLGPRSGLLSPLNEETAPAHKAELVSAWLDLLVRVNVATRVGVEKLSRSHPIRLLVDIERPENSPWE